MRKINKYKWINIAFFLFTVMIYGTVHYLFSANYCVDGCNSELKSSIFNPLYAGGHIVIMCLGLLLIFPADLFRRWLFYVGGPFLILSLLEISSIETRGGGITAPTRVGMAELLMQILFAITVLFIVGYYLLTWYKNRSD